jgi:glycosyltransferase involved in cell wall biosynthesis
MIGIIKSFLIIISSLKRYDLFVGSNCLNASLGLLCKVIGVADKVVFFSPDYVENRFDSFLLNWTYRKLDHFCVKHCDLVWNSSAICFPDPMMVVREKDGLPKKYRKNQIQTPDGTDNRLSLGLENRVQLPLKIGFIGHIREGMGVSKLIEVFDKLSDSFSDIQLVIIGSGPLEKEVERRAKKNKNIFFHGYIGEIERVYQILSECSIAVAPYENGSITQFTDPGKIKVYLSLGLPVVVNNVPLVAKEIEKCEAGICVNFEDEDGLYNAMVKLIKNKKLRMKYSHNSSLLCQKYNWDNIFIRSINCVYDERYKNSDLNMTEK